MSDQTRGLKPFKPGQSGNLAGRPKGSRHRLSEKFLADLAADFDDEGMAAIRAARAEDPAAYIRVVASLLPKQTEKLPNPLEGLTDDELAKLDELLASFGDTPVREGGNDEEDSGK